MVNLDQLYRDTILLLAQKEAAGLAFDQITSAEDTIAGVSHLVSMGIIALPIRMATEDKSVEKYTILVARNDAVMDEMLTRLRSGLSHATITVLSN
jgi:hypothetical protein